MTVALGKRRRTRVETASSRSSTAPDDATITGSTTSGKSVRASHSATASMIGFEKSIPVLAASTPMSSATASSWAVMKSAGSSWMARTPTVLWAVRATIADIPWQPAAANALRSACIPAPPPESEVAMVRQRATVIAALPTLALPRSGSRV